MKKNFAMKKLYYSISEVSRIIELEQYVLRYWETEFEMLRPAKNLAGNRVYTNKDIKLILYIKKLLREEKYTIEGAKQHLKSYYQKEEAENVKLNQSKETGAYRSASEMSLFEPSAGDQSDPEMVTKNPKLKDDLIQLRTFLTNLLKDIS
ncbi:MAG TPA: MerR family transcriptional regulator [Ignavibacteria bacterium]|nr:MerR family transcriptional regulator [Ignavibacteria bacterium]HRJ99138.1 MerR family transcriptional regulator [Ignavibacteria bacterium]